MLNKSLLQLCHDDIHIAPPPATHTTFSKNIFSWLLLYNATKHFLKAATTKECMYVWHYRKKFTCSGGGIAN